MAYSIGIDIGSDSIKSVVLNQGTISTFGPIKISGKPIHGLIEIIQTMKKALPDINDNIQLAFTGSGSEKISETLGLPSILETEAISAAFNTYFSDTRFIIEIGATGQKYLILSAIPSASNSTKEFSSNSSKPTLFLDDAILGGKCAGGGGSFLEYMHKRLNFKSFEDFIKAGLSVEIPAGISGRCAVFAESDVVHHYQKGMSKERIVAGIHKAVARNFKSIMKKGEVPSGKIAFIGGTSVNDCLKKYIIEELKLSPEQLYVPKYNIHAVALGAALKAKQKISIPQVLDVLEKQAKLPFEYESRGAIVLEKSVILKQPTVANVTGTIELGALGVDIGSVSTKVVAIARVGGEIAVLASHYRRTEGNPIEAVKKAIEAVYNELKAKGIVFNKIVSATTGSGRYLTGYFLGANHVINEVTAQGWGVSTYIKDEEITIIEIGGQDSKFIKVNNGYIVDFEMNWACAAGTGSLIEKHAKNLDIPIEEFGDYALKGTKLPVINDTCSVFAESALLHFQHNNVSKEDLCGGACLASAKNYLAKVLRNRPVGEKVVFQGAVAFNKGILAAFETLLNRPIIVPPYPHLTGALGAARTAFEDAEANGTTAKFRGFEEVMRLPYTLSTFQCKKCGNECQVNKFDVDNDSFYQGDRCDLYSGIKKEVSKGDNLPDLFQWRENLLLNIYDEHKTKSGGSQPNKSKKIVIPRGLLFNDYFPFFQSFFEELGFEVKPSRKTDKKIISLGVEKTISGPCFPIKVAQGHTASLLDENFDYIFIPRIISTEKSFGSYKLCSTCPYIQSSPDMFKHSLGIDDTKLLTPTFHFQWGYKHLLAVFTEIGKQLHKNPSDVKNALDKAVVVFDDFKRRIKKKGEEILANSPKAFVVIGKPYAIYDPLLNMDIGKKVRDEGFIAIPVDFLPLDNEDASEAFENIYAAQGQKKLSAARYISRHKNLHPLIITYFGCGPDAFVDQFFKQESSKSYLTIQIDEHSSDTGVLTRIQAYLSSLSMKAAFTEKKRVDTNAKLLHQTQGKRIWVPHMSGVSTVLAAALRSCGIDAQPLERSPDASLSLARENIHGDVCVPMLYTTEDILYKASQKDFDPSKEAFFQGRTQGPCRYGLYYMLQKIILEKYKKNVDIFTLDNSRPTNGLGAESLLRVMDSFFAHDQLEKMLHHTRPYEVNKGESEKIFYKYMDLLCEEIEKTKYNWKSFSGLAKTILGSHLEGIGNLLSAAQDEFSKVPRQKRNIPRIGLIGEFFVRCHSASNQDLVRKIEKLGGEVWLAPATEFLIYVNYISTYFADKKWRHLGDMPSLLKKMRSSVANHAAARDEHLLFSRTLPYMEGFDDIPAKTLVEYGSKYMSKDFSGEAVCSFGKAMDFFNRGLDGIISAIPFNCMPGIVVADISHKVRQDHGNIPFLTLDYDGFFDTTKDQQLAIFMGQVRERHGFK